MTDATRDLTTLDVIAGRIPGADDVTGYWRAYAIWRLCFGTCSWTLILVALTGLAVMLTLPEGWRATSRDTMLMVIGFIVAACAIIAFRLMRADLIRIARRDHADWKIGKVTLPRRMESRIYYASCIAICSLPFIALKEYLPDRNSVYGSAIMTALILVSVGVIIGFDIWLKSRAVPSMLSLMRK